MKKKPVMQKDLPDDFLVSIVKLISAYSVPLLSFDGFLGSGTLIRTNSKYGILTARHVLSRQNPPLVFSNSFDDLLLLPLNDGLCRFCLPHPLLREIIIGDPVSDEHGPDLTFIEIAPSSELETLKAKKAFWNIEANGENKLNHVQKAEGLCVYTGYPQVKSSFKKEDNNYYVNSYLDGLIGSLECDLIHSDGNFDYLDSKAIIEPKGAVPKTVKGMSGGGIWAIDIHYKESTNSFHVDDMTLCGVAFYEQYVSEEQNIIRGHFAKSIYINSLKKIR